jgi:hypothetical protein
MILLSSLSERAAKNNSAEHDFVLQFNATRSVFSEIGQFWPNQTAL